MKTIPNLVDPYTTLVTGKPELRVEIDRERASDLGVKVGDIAQVLNTMVAGQEVTDYNEGTDQYNVRVRAAGEFRVSSEGLQRMIVSSAKGGWVSLDNVVKITEGTGPSTIERQDRERRVLLMANVAPGGSQADVVARITAFAPTTAPRATPPRA
jgi:HAE1 family hydrophobic/amphiphilic exporter-1